jgi:hypothetical protein
LMVHPHLGFPWLEEITLISVFMFLSCPTCVHVWLWISSFNKDNNYIRFAPMSMTSFYHNHLFKEFFSKSSHI